MASVFEIPDALTLHLIPSAFIVLPKLSSLIPEAGCGQSPRKRQTHKCLIFYAKKEKECINGFNLVIL